MRYDVAGLLFQMDHEGYLVTKKAQSRDFG